MVCHCWEGAVPVAAQLLIFLFPALFCLTIFLCPGKLLMQILFLANQAFIVQHSLEDLEIRSDLEI